MKNKALVIIDIQNDITKNYKSVIDNINTALSTAQKNDIHIVYIKHNNLSAGTRTFKPDTKGAELVPELDVLSDNIFIKSKGNALTSPEFSDFISKNEITDFFIAGADAVACVKSTCFNMCKQNYNVKVLSDCITSYDLKQLDKMISYYESKGCEIITLKEFADYLG